MTDAELIKLAKDAYKNAYAPYSKSKVGAALLCSDGTFFKGCNVENASYGLTICAERTAISSAISNGKKKFTKIAVASNTKREFSPCGACRQILAELSPNITVIWHDKTKKIKSKSINALLPDMFKKPL